MAAAAPGSVSGQLRGGGSKASTHRSSKASEQQSVPHPTHTAWHRFRLATPHTPPPPSLLLPLVSPGKTTTAQAVAESAGLRYINVGDWVKEQQLHCGYDEEHEAFIIDEDKVCVWGVGCV